MNVIPLATALGLSQIGEFSFVLARVGVASDSISLEFYSLILTTTIITMFLTPFVSRMTAPLYAVKNKWRKPFINWLTIGGDSQLVGVSIGESDIRNKTGITIAGILRDGKLYSNPSPEVTFKADDLAGVLGTTAQLNQFGLFAKSYSKISQ